MTAKHRASPKISITLPTALLKEADQLAATQGRSRSNAISYLLKKGIEIERQAEAVLKEAETPTYKTKTIQQKQD